MYKSLIVCHLDREPIDEKIRVDYKWFKEENEENPFYIEDVPCIRQPFEKGSCFSKEVRYALDMIVHLQVNEEIPQTVSFIDVEDMIVDNEHFSKIVSDAEKKKR